MAHLVLRPDELSSGKEQTQSTIGEDVRTRISSPSSAGGSQRERMAMVRKESADVQEYELCLQHDVNKWSQWDDMVTDMNENMDELSFISSAVGYSAGWHEPQIHV